MSKPVLNFLYEALSTEKIAIITGYNSETIRKRLKKYGIDTSRKAQTPRPSKKQLLELYPEKTIEEVGKHFNVGATLAHKWFTHYKIKVTKKQRQPRSDIARANMSVAQKGRKYPERLKGMYKDCPSCGVKFYVSPPRLRQSDKHYCTQECKHKGSLLEHIEKSCLYCDAALSRRKGETAGNYRKRTYCNVICSTKAYPPPTLIGEDNPRWKGDDARRKQSRVGQSKWTKEVKDRDKHICQHCGASDVPIVAHHILSFEDFPEHRTDLENGITLCNPCHYKEHDWSLTTEGIKSLINEHGIEERRWIGNCLNCDTQIIKQASDMKRSGKAGDGTYRTYAFCGRSCAAIASGKARKGVPANKIKGFDVQSIFEQWQKDKAQD
ncbi:HNH endonuclease [Amylibacter sp.]|nr:HNH endonuclease [Amylibacter sp.]